MTGRPRRTRLYDCNYNIGQSYYRPTIDQLDRKLYRRSEPAGDHILKPRTDIDDFFDQDLKTARRRAEKVIAEDGIFDSKNLKLGKALPTAEDDFSEEMQSTLSRIRASKKLLTAGDDDIDDTLATMKRRAKLDLGEKLLDLSGEDEAVGGTIRRRALKMVSRSAVDDSNYNARDLTKWTALEDDSAHSAAALRAKATKARLADIESEMFDRSERQAARERRVANMKKVLAENDDEFTHSAKALTLSSKAEKKVTF
ncbi:uncharacterized protein LOC129793818 [Lutzomyia longipalpis]|uniref:Uncharacterized protein n=1 Tax=Lutzomyia longipalpis TaxID=7200 RepID=A0A7G3ALC4_LUTLO|nr:uncharacterized protein LOC129793818 [Lutzomyia longipalpis]XP_055690202.1 uncharacterized protein LOC129793818 [Lutzomyia longipalpis]XP_055690204.1 uncharacterized protein LOC129793818 [Lutzomyia longipalpis]